MNIYKHYPWPSVHRNVLRNQYGLLNSWELQHAAQSSKNFIQRLKKWTVLEGHTGCVNTVAWNASGYLLLTGSDDYLLNIYDFFQNKLMHSIPSGHQANIFSAKFLPCTSDMKIVSCSGDGMLHYNELGSDYGKNYFNCHSGTAYEVLVTPGDPNTYLSCGEDGTIRMFDLRSKTKCHCQECSEDILIDCRHAITSISVNPLLPYHLAAGCKDSFVRVFDRRMLGTSNKTRSVNRNKGWMPGLFCKFRPEKLKRDMSCRITSLQYSNDGKDLLVSYCTDYVYSFTVQDKTGKVMDLTVPNTVQNSANKVDHKSDNLDELPPVKRLRLRGDWSDTGPQARPETDEESSSEHNLMQRMSELFSRWLEDAMYTNLGSASTSSDSSHQSLNNESEAVSEVHIDSRRNSQNGLYVSDADGDIASSSVPNEDLRSSIEDGETYSDVSAHHSLSEQRRVDTSYCSCENSSSVEIDDWNDSNQNKNTELLFNQISVNCELNCSNDDAPDRTRNKGFVSNIIDNDVTLSEEQNNHSSYCEETNIVTNHDEGMSCTSSSIANSQNVVNGNTVPQNDINKNEENSLPVDLHLQQEVPNVRLEDSFSCAMSQSSRDVAALRIQNFLRNYKKGSPKIDNHVSKPKKIYLPTTKMIFKGHRNSKTMIKEANFWGDDYVVSGSDCGRIFIWNRHTGELTMLLQGDRHVVNCVQPHPYDPILATSGIDHDVKIWAPSAEDVADLSDLDEIVSRNERMLEESRDTITVPASFVLRMLASFGSRRNRRGGARSRSEHSDTEDDS